MAYSKTNRLNMRRVPTGGGYGLHGLGGLSWSDVKGGLSSVLNFYDTSQQNKGRADQASADLNAAIAAQKTGGLDTTTLVIGGVAVAGILFFALRKK